MAVRRLFMAAFVLMTLTWLFEARAETLRELFSAGDIVFASNDIVDARAQPEPDGTASILITFETDAAARLNRLRAADKGQPLPLMLGRRLLASPMIEDTTESDDLPVTLLITGRFSREDAAALALAISGKPPLPDSLEEIEH